jgi:light-regulated signal transduction histidine kinase (bacteriophytochrome)
MKQMNGDLLDYAKINSVEMAFREFRLNEASEIELQMIEDQVRENNAIFTIPELPMVFGSKLQFAHLFQNLFENAIKYRSSADPFIHVSYENKGDSVTILVKDNGMGFDQESANEVFGFMKRLHSHDSIPGTGIGLSACKRNLEIHGGTIGAISEPGKGSTFYFTFPNLNMNPNI